MFTHALKVPESASPAAAGARISPESRHPLQRLADASAQVDQAQALQRLVEGGRCSTAQCQDEEEEPLQGRFAPAQLEGVEEEEPLQGRFVPGLQRKVDPTTEVNGVPVNDDPGLEQEADVMGARATQFTPETSSDAPMAQRAPKPNETGMPDNLKAGIEHLSGTSMDSVKVHYNSEKPAQLNALAYAQGTDIHLGPGQEQHLPHEAWHVVQQAQGRVHPTTHMKGGVQVNDDKGLEYEQDIMGVRSHYDVFQQTKGRFTAVARSSGGDSVTSLFINSHLGNQAKAEQIARNRGLEVSHTIDIKELGELLGEMATRQSNGYHVPGNKVINPTTGLMQYLTGKLYNIWEIKIDKKGRLKPAKLVNRRFYYDAPVAHASACHHFDGIHV